MWYAQAVTQHEQAGHAPKVGAAHDPAPPARPLRLGPRTQSRLAVSLVAGPQLGERVEPRLSGTLQIGRASDNDVQLREPQAALYHLELSVEGDGFRAFDLGTRSGTWQGAARVVHGVLPWGSELRVGDSVLRVEPAPSVELPGLELPPAPKFVASSQRVRVALASLTRFAPGRVPILLCGARGTGKATLARLAHDWAEAADQAAPPGVARPWVEVSCSGSAREVAARLFGYVQGAFRGALEDAPGALSRAAGGTLLLRAVDELPPEVQALLAEALGVNEFCPLGTNQRLPLEARLVCATTQDLRASVNAGYFREDLYFRIGAARLELPELRERLEDLEPLVRQFEADSGFAAGRLGPGWTERVRGRRFHGNLRELRELVADALRVTAG